MIHDNRLATDLALPTKVRALVGMQVVKINAIRRVEGGACR